MPELEDLLVDRAELDRKLLAEVLVGFVGIDGGRKEIVTRPGWEKLGVEQKVLVLLLARKAMAAMPEVGLETEGMSPKDIEAATGVRGGTLRPALSGMRKQSRLAQDKAKRYYVPTHAVNAVCSVITGDGRENGQRSHAKRPGRSR